MMYDIWRCVKRTFSVRPKLGGTTYWLGWVHFVFDMAQLRGLGIMWCLFYLTEGHADEKQRASADCH
jgi:hypothetical protein